jgi:hypothetical protein
MHCAISLTNQKQSVVSWREFAICCAHGLCSLAYCFSHCALDFPPTHPIVILPCLRWRPLLAGFLFQAACLRSLAACRPTTGCLPPLLGSLSALPLAVCSISGYWPLPLPGVRLLAVVCICASAYLILWFVRLCVCSFVPSPLVLMSVSEVLIVCCVCLLHSVNGGAVGVVLLSTLLAMSDVVFVICIMPHPLVGLAPRLVWVISF